MMNKYMSFISFIFSSPARTSAFLFSSIPLWVILLMLFKGAIDPVESVILLVIAFMSRALIKSLVDKRFFKALSIEVMGLFYRFVTFIVFFFVIFSVSIVIVFSDNILLILSLIIFIVLFTLYHVLFQKPAFTDKLWKKTLPPPSTFFDDILAGVVWISVLLSHGNPANIACLLAILFIIHLKKIFKMYESVV